MNPPLILREAEIELWEAVTYYEERSKGLGLDFSVEAEKSLEVMQHFPESREPRQDGTRRYLTQRFPYVVVYTYLENQTWVLAFAHCKRQPGYWRDRIQTVDRQITDSESPSSGLSRGRNESTE